LERIKSRNDKNLIHIIQPNYFNQTTYLKTSLSDKNCQAISNNIAKNGLRPSENDYPPPDIASGYLGWMPIYF
jgi:hypothetical protein